MANSKQNFLGLVKIEGIQTSAYNDLVKTGKLVFAHLWDSVSDNVKVNERFIINANGVEYNIATKDIFESLEARVATLEAWKPDVDSSIDRLDSSVSALETLLADYSEWRTSVDASIDALQAKDVEIDSSIDRLDTSVSALEVDVNELKSVNPLVDTSISAVLDGANNVTIIVEHKHADSTTHSDSFTLESDSKYIAINGTNDNINIAAVTTNIASADALNTGLADVYDVKQYVDNQVSTLEQALIFKGSADDYSDLPIDTSAGWTYVATAAFEIPVTKTTTGVVETVENGDLIIANDADKWIVVQRNLDGAVMADDVLDSSKLIIGDGGQKVKTIDVTAEGLETAIANANSAIQGVNAATTQNTYVTISVENGTDPSTKDVSAVLSVVDTSAALNTVAATGSLVDAKAVKDLIDTKVADVKVEATLNSSTPTYVDASAVVDAAGRVISASIGVKTATLVDASNGSTGLAMAEDVYAELAKVEEVTATSITTMATNIGLGTALNQNWTQGSGINEASTYREVIEELYGQVGGNVVNSIGGAHGVISIDTTGDANHNVVFHMDSSTLEANVDLSNIDASIDRLDASVNALETEVSTYKVKTIEGETGISERANDEYVAVAAATPDTNGKVVLDASVQLAEAIDLSGISGATSASATGLATDATVKDYVAYALAWEVIGDTEP